MAAPTEAMDIIEGATYSGQLDFRGFESLDHDQSPVYSGDVYVRPPFEGSETFFDELTVGQAKMRHFVTTKSVSVVRVEASGADETRASYKIAGFAHRLIEKLNQIESIKQ
jgi:hypothetical protein